MPRIRYITHEGVTQSLKAWAKQTGIPSNTISSRIDLGWDLARALFEPKDERYSRGGRHTPAAIRPCPQMKPHPQFPHIAWCRWQENGVQRSRRFGKWGTDEARKQYQQFAHEWIAGTVSLPARREDMTILQLSEQWLNHAERTYVKRGKMTSEVKCVKSALSVLCQVYEDDTASSFDARKLRTVREAMAKRGWVRESINAHVGRLVRMFKWAESEALVRPGVYASLTLVEPLLAGRRDDIPEGEVVKPAPIDHVLAVLCGDHLHPKADRREALSAMIWVQLFTGMRPGELCGLRKRDLDFSRDEWRYEVTEYNKMLHKHQPRTVFFGPEAQKEMAPFLETCGDDFIFRLPAARRGSVPSPLNPNRYRSYIQEACKRARVPAWTPNQIRHTTATELMNQFENDKDVAAVLGNSPEVMRRVYAYRPGEEAARRIAKLTG